MITPWPAAPDAMTRSNRATIARLGAVAVAGLPPLPDGSPASLAAGGAALPLDAWLSGALGSTAHARRRAFAVVLVAAAVCAVPAAARAERDAARGGDAARAERDAARGRRARAELDAARGGVRQVAELPRCAGDRAARCGRIRVPLHRTDPAGPQLTVRFRVYPRRDRSRPAGVPIVAAEGGPGYGTIDSAASYRFLLGPLGRDHDLILIDNRGTGRSGAIDCQRLQAGGATTRATSGAARGSSARRPTPTAAAPRPTTSRRPRPRSRSRW